MSALPRKPDDLLSRVLTKVNAEWEEKEKQGSTDVPDESGPDDETTAVPQPESGAPPASEDAHGVAAQQHEESSDNR